MKKLMTVMAIVAVFGLGVAQADILGPYTADGNTMHLWHFDEPSGVYDAEEAPGVVGAPFSLDGSAWAGSMGDASYAGLNTTGRTKDAENRTFGGATSMANLFGDADGPWTVEALVYYHTTSTGQYPLITSMDTPGIWQLYPVDPGGATIFQDEMSVDWTNWYNVAGAITCNHNTWYHAAATYNGNPADPSNFKLYWTEMNPGLTEAALVGTGQIIDAGEYCDNFNTGNGGGGGHDNYIDEIRISNIARAANDMMFGTAAPPGPVIPEPAGLGVVGLALLAVRRKRS